MSSQAICSESAVQDRSGENRWAEAGLDTNVDFYLKCGDIIAFKLEWFPIRSEKWSDWFVVGVNDIDAKSDGPNYRLKRMWSYFADHRHKYIICKQNQFMGCTCLRKTVFPASINEADVFVAADVDRAVKEK